MKRQKQSIALRRLKKTVERLDRSLAAIQTAQINSNGAEQKRQSDALERIAEALHDINSTYLRACNAQVGAR